jgi:hypothetical protein
MTPRHILLNALAVAVGLAALLLTLIMIGDLRIEYHEGSPRATQLFFIYLFLFGGTGATLLTTGLINLLSRRPREWPTRLQATAWLLTCVGIPLALWAYRIAADLRRTRLLGDANRP